MLAEVLCLATALFFEARSEPLEGQIAVGEVIMNRVESDKWPDTICEVVNQHKQFSYTHDGKSDNPDVYDKHADKESWEALKVLAQDIYDNKWDTGLTADHYHAKYVKPAWASRFDKVLVVGTHIFYKS